MAKKRSPKGFEFRPQRFSVSLVVYPSVAMIRQDALELAKNLGSHLELTDIHMTDETWEFRRPQARRRRITGPHPCHRRRTGSDDRIQETCERPRTIRNPPGSGGYVR